MKSMADALAQIAGILQGDDVDFDALLAPGAVVWHNNDDVETPAKEALSRAAGLRAMVDGVHVVVVRQEPLPSGVVAQIEIRGTVASTGGSLCARNCVILTTTDDGRLQRLDEYVDPTFAAQLGLA